MQGSGGLVRAPTEQLTVGEPAARQVFAVMWAIAALAHVVGNPAPLWPDPTLRGFALLCVGMSACVVLARPRQVPLLALCACIGLSALAETPVLGNHWLLAALASTAYLVGRGDFERRSAGPRWALLAFYPFAAFAKLNSGFIDTDVSCAVFYADQSALSWGLPAISDTPAAVAVVAATLAIELSVPLLLLLPATRLFGVALAMGFHLVISFDLSQHFYDFTAVLFALFALFLPPAAAAAVVRRSRQWGPMRLLRPAALAFALVGTALAVTAVPGQRAMLSVLVFPVWIFGSVLWWLAVTTWVWRHRAAPPSPLPWRTSLAAGAVIAVAVTNGVLPYLEVKTASSYTMYSNLVTAQGESTHLIVSKTLPLRDTQFVEVIGSTEPLLAPYVEQGWLVAMPSLIAFGDAHPDARAWVSIDGDPEREVRLDDLGQAPWWWRLLPLRSVDEDRPARCQTGFFPAL